MQNALLDSNSFPKVSLNIFFEIDFFIGIPHPYNFNNNKKPSILGDNYMGDISLNILFCIFYSKYQNPNNKLWQRYKGDMTCSIENVILQIK